MEMKAPYLEAIQAIAGQTAAEKQKEIHKIASDIANRATRPGIFNEELFSDVPLPLQPLVNVEVAKLLRRCDGIITALKSEDIMVQHRAFQATWFFKGIDTTLVNAKYFSENVFPEISLDARQKIVTNFGRYLRNTSLAADLFDMISQKYGHDEAVPLLFACEEQFAFNSIVENKIKLSEKALQRLYTKYPNLVVRYLGLCASDSDDVRDPYAISIYDYLEFLPHLAIKRLDDFMALYDNYDHLNVELGTRAANLFLQKHADLLVANPSKYLSLVNLKIVTRKLLPVNFASMFRNLFPKEKKDFRFSKLYDSLKYMKADNEKINLLLETFRAVYDQDLLDCPDLVTTEVIRLLPGPRRVEQARLKLKDDTDWHLYDQGRCWRCYLPTSESIPLIKTAIANQSDANKRIQLVELLVLTCQINNDNDAILDALNYVYDRHRNERNGFIFNFLGKVQESMKLSTFTAAHWLVINKYLKLAEIQDVLVEKDYIISNVLEDAIHYCFSNEIPFNDYLRLIVKMKMEAWYANWIILKEYPEWERKCLKMFIDAIPEQYPFDNEIWTIDKTLSVITRILDSLYEFNDTNQKAQRKLDKFSVQDFPWLIERIKRIMSGNEKNDDHQLTSILEQIRKHETDIYNSLIDESDKFWELEHNVILDVLKKDPQRILDHWEPCEKKVQELITSYSSQAGQLFVVKSRWYQIMPIRLFKLSLKNYNNEDNNRMAVEALVLLVDGETFTKIILPSLPEGDKIDIESEDSRSNYGLLSAIASSLRKVNPPVSLDVIARLCVGDYLQMALRSIFSVCRRIPVSNVIVFSKTLIDRPVSVMKHGIRLMSMVAPLQELYDFLVQLWNTQAHRSIRAVILKKMYDLFRKQPDLRSWRMIKVCIENLDVKDDREIFDSLIELKMVPNEYLREYIESTLGVLEKLQRASEEPERSEYLRLSCRLIQKIDTPILNILPEEYSQKLIRKYLFDFNYDDLIWRAGKSLIEQYIFNENKYNGTRFDFFASYFEETVKNYWDKPHLKDPNFYPANYMIHDLLENVCEDFGTKFDPKIFERLFKIFRSTLLPCQDTAIYMNLLYCIDFYNSQSTKDFATRIIQRIPSFIETFTPELTMLIGKQLKDFIEHRSFDGIEPAESKTTIIEVFLNNGSIHCAVIAAILLYQTNDKTLIERHKQIISRLHGFENPAVRSLLYERLNSFTYYPQLCK